MPFFRIRRILCLRHAWLLALASLLPGQVPDSTASLTPVPNRAPLHANAFEPLPLGAVHPRGWLLRQLQLQAGGLTGHLDEFWNDVGPNSGWLGGTGESWERGPYYLDGLLPLAYQLDDDALKQKAHQWVEWSLTSQQPSGQFGPKSNDDWWPRMVMLKVLAQYEEVSGDARVVPFMTRYFHFELKELPKRPLRDWGKYRWQDNVYTVLWLYNRTGDASLLPLARLLKKQGYDWEAQFANFEYMSKQSRQELGLTHKGPIPERAMQTHGVNNAMALKVAPISYLLSSDSADRFAFVRQMKMLDRFHGLPNGMFSGDEHFAGVDPSQGIELCAVVEAMFSFEQAFAIFGDAGIADRLERVAYNALPATLSNDMWSHQYDQQPNQIACTRAHRQWSTNGDDSNLFGLEPNFGCCTANLHQGWPKFVSSLWLATPDKGLVAAAYAPSEVRTRVQGQDVSVTEDTEYPFQGTVHFTVHTSKPATFPLSLRIPLWASGARLKLNDASAIPLPPGVLINHFYVLRQTWKDGDTVELILPMTPRVSRWTKASAAFERGPLVFALPLQEDWKELKQYKLQSADWQLTSTTPWNYAVQLGECASQASEHAASAIPFDTKHPAVTLAIRGRRLPRWEAAENSAGAVPNSPVTSEAPWSHLTLVPYGAAKLRVTVFPVLTERSTCPAEKAASTGSRMLR